MSLYNALFSLMLIIHTINGSMKVFEFFPIFFKENKFISTFADNIMGMHKIASVEIDYSKIKSSIRESSLHLKGKLEYDFEACERIFSKYLLACECFSAPPQKLSDFSIQGEKIICQGNDLSSVKSYEIDKSYLACAIYPENETNSFYISGIYILKEEEIDDWEYVLLYGSMSVGTLAILIALLFCLKLIIAKCSKEDNNEPLFV